jgi:segregation and condensation protein B
MPDNPSPQAGNGAAGRPEAGEPAALPDNVTTLPSADRRNHLRMVEALLFAAEEPLDLPTLAARLPKDADAAALLEELRGAYASRGVNLVQIDGRWMFRTAEDLAFLMHREEFEERRLSRAALETLAIIAYHQPVTRAEVEEIRGVSISKGTLDVLLETGWVRMRGRRRTPGRPITYGTTNEFLQHFGLEALIDLPGLEDLKAAGLLSSRVPPDFIVPTPVDGEELLDDEDPLSGDEQDDFLTPLQDDDEQ